MEKLHVVTCISNPARFKTRYKLYREFERRMLENPVVELWTAEMAFGDRPFEITENDNIHHLQVRSTDELWQKENLLNLMVQKIPNDGNPVAFIDADVQFMRPDWAEETLQLLKHHQVIQMFSHTVDLDDNYTPAVDGEQMEGMVYRYHQQAKERVAAMEATRNSDDYFIDQSTYNTDEDGHGGYAWAWRREALDKVGGLIDFTIIGSADWQMGMCLVGKTDKVINKESRNVYSVAYHGMLTAWAERAAELRQDIGYLPGYIAHYWHGPKSKRGYNWRYLITHAIKFDPLRDLTRDSQGLLRLHDDGSSRFIKFRDALRHYFRSRDEDKPSE